MCINSVFEVAYGGGVINGYGFRIAMSRAWRCKSESFKIHSLKDNVFHLIFHTPKTRDYALYEGPWNFPWDPVTRSPPIVFDSTYFNYCIF